MISMTGYGKASAIKDEYEIEIEIKSVNAKFLDLKCYIPKEVNYLDLPLRTTVNQHYKRGSIELRMHYVDRTKPQIRLNEEKLKNIKSVFTKIRSILKTDQLPMEYLLKEYDLIEFKSTLFDRNDFNLDIVAVLKKAIANQQKMAQKEGIGIKKMIVKSTDMIIESLLGIENTIPKFRQELFDKMKARIQEVLPLANKQNLEQRLMQELAVYLDKYDIQEEINRLKEHIDTLHKYISENEGNDLGKTLSFIFQEMQREANTLGSKYSNYHSFANILLIKEEVEKCREIVQNVM